MRLGSNEPAAGSKHTPVRGRLSTMLTGKGDAVGAPVAVIAVPLPPISTLPAYFAVPTVAILNHVVPAEGEPIDLAAALAVIVVEQFLERDGFVPTGKFVFCGQLCFGQGFVDLDVLDGAEGEGGHVDPVEGVLAIDTAAGFAARLVVFETVAASIPAACFAATAYFFFRFFFFIVH
jgi:hypothetical protein